MTVIRALVFLLHFTIVPIAFGRLITYRLVDSKQKSFIETYLIGWLGSLGLFFVLCSAITWWQNFTMVREVVTGGFTLLVRMYSVFVSVLVVLWFFLDIKNRKNFLDYLCEKKEYVIALVKRDRFTGLYIVGFLVLLIVQLYFAYGYEINEWSYDDFDYVVNSNDDIAFDMIANVSVVNGTYPVTEPKRVATSWPAYIAYLSYVSNFEVTTVCHTILPVILLMLAYGIYYYMSKSMFDDLENRMIFMIVLSVLFIFGAYSHYSLTFRLLCTLWQGKAILCALIIPFLTAYMPKVLQQEQNDFWNLLAVFAVSLGTSSLTTMSILLLSMLFVFMFVTMCVYKRRLRGFKFVVAGLLGPAIQLGFYQLINMLLIEQQSWGKIWFGTNL